MPTEMTTRGRRAHRLKNLFMRVLLWWGLEASEETDKRPCSRVETRSAIGRPHGDRPRGSAHVGIYPHIPCQIRKSARIGKFAHESGRSAQALERFAPVEAGGVERFAPGDGANRPSGWRDAPLDATYGQPSATCSASSARSGDYRPWSPGGVARCLERLRHGVRASARLLSLAPAAAEHYGLRVKASPPGSGRRAS